MDRVFLSCLRESLQNAMYNSNREEALKETRKLSARCCWVFAMCRALALVLIQIYILNFYNNSMMYELLLSQFDT